jgi:hypothetical protein
VLAYAKYGDTGGRHSVMSASHVFLWFSQTETRGDVRIQAPGPSTAPLAVLRARHHQDRPASRGPVPYPKSITGLRRLLA